MDVRNQSTDINEILSMYTVGFGLKVTTTFYLFWIRQVAPCQSEADHQQEYNWTSLSRMLPKDDEAPVPDTGGGTSEPVDDIDFVVTLRPTQIRTFVIWFDTNRKNYNT